MDPLQKLCLSFIIDNIDLYYAIYSASKDTTLKRNLEGLRRIYSSDILTELEANNVLKAAHTDFLINPFLKKLDTRWFKGCSWYTIANKIAEIGSNIENVNFHGNEMPWEMILCHLPNLKSMCYNNCECDNKFMHSLATYCSKIESVHIQQSSVSDDGIKYLCYDGSGKISCPLLKEIKQKLSRITDEGIAYLLKHLPTLEIIDHCRIQEVLFLMHLQDIGNLNHIRPYKLTELYLKTDNPHDSKFDDLMKICASMCPNLRTLVCEVYKPEHLKLCSKFSKLKKLYLYCYQDFPQTFDDFSKIMRSNIECLYLRNFSITLSILEQYFPYLKKLTIENVIFLPDVMYSALPLQNLEKISLQYLNLSDIFTSQAVCRLLLSSKNLKDLSILMCKMYTSEIQTQILKCCEQCNLRNVNLDQSRVNAELLQGILLKCPSLKFLNLVGTMLDGENSHERHVRMDYVCRQLKGIALVLPNKPKIVRHDCQFESDEEDREVLPALDPFKSIIIPEFV